MTEFSLFANFPPGAGRQASNQEPSLYAMVSGLWGVTHSLPCLIENEGYDFDKVVGAGVYDPARTQNR